MTSAREGRAGRTAHSCWRAQALRTLPLITSVLCFVAPASAQDDVFSLRGLVITASPTPRAADAIANHVTILSGERLRAMGVRSIAEALRDVPGVSVVRNGSLGSVTSIFLRGGESDYTLILVDGVQVNQAGGGFDFAGLTTDNVERVEIVRGPASALYGSDAVAGVIHVITRTGRGAAHATLALEGGSFGRQDWAADLRGGTEGAGYSLSVARRSTDGALALNNGHVNTTASGSVRFRPDEVTQVAVNFRIADREYHFPTDGTGAVVDENSFTFSDEVSAQFSVTRVLSDHVSLEARLAVNDTDGGLDDAQDSPRDTLGFFAFSSMDHFRRVSGELRSHIRLDPLVITAGFEVEDERQRSRTESDSEFGPSNGRSKSQRQNRAYFLHTTGTASAVSFNVGGRIEDNDRFGQIVSWQAGAAWRAPGVVGTRLRASVGRAIKEPTFFENFATGFAIGNADLEPERSFSWDVGVEQSLLAGALTASVTFFDQSFSDLIQFTFAPPNPGDPNFFNVAAATSRGIEFDLGGRAGLFSGGLGWTWLSTKVTDSGFDEGPGAGFVEGERLLRRPEHAVTLRAAVGLDRLALSAGLSIVGERSDRDFSTFPATRVVLPGYQSLSLGGEWRVFEGSGGRPSLAILVRGENLLDERYQEVLGFPAPGRGLYLGGRVGIGGG